MILRQLSIFLQLLNMRKGFSPVLTEDTSLETRKKDYREAHYKANKKIHRRNGLEERYIRSEALRDFLLNKDIFSFADRKSITYSSFVNDHIVFVNDYYGGLTLHDINKPRYEREIFHIENELYAGAKQVVCNFDEDYMFIANKFLSNPNYARTDQRAAIGVFRISSAKYLGRISRANFDSHQDMVDYKVFEESEDPGFIFKPQYLSISTNFKTKEGEFINFSSPKKITKVEKVLADKKNNVIYFLTKDASLLRFTKAGEKSYQFDREIILPLNLPLSGINNIDINSVGDICFSTSRRAFFLNAKSLANYPEIDSSKTEKWDFTKIQEMDKRYLCLADIDNLAFDSSMGVVSKVPKREVQAIKKLNASFNGRIFCHENRSQLLPEPRPYYHQGREPMCAASAMLNVLDYLDLYLKPEYIDAMLASRISSDRGFEVFDILEELPVVYENLHFSQIPDLDSSLDAFFEEVFSVIGSEHDPLINNAKIIKKELDKGAKIFLCVNSPAYYSIYPSEGHALAIVGYQIEEQGMQLMVIDSNCGPRMVTLEDLTGSLNLHREALSIRKHPLLKYMKTFDNWLYGKFLASY